MGRAVEQRFLEDPFAAPPKSPPDTKTRTWLRVAGELPDEPAVHAAALTFVSDLTLLSAGFARLGGGWPDFVGASLDHAVWFHQPVRADDWFLYETDSPAASRRPGAVLRPDLVRRRHARRHGGPGGPHPVTDGLTGSSSGRGSSTSASSARSAGGARPAEAPTARLRAAVGLAAARPVRGLGGLRARARPAPASARARSAARAAACSAAAAAKSAASQSWPSRSSAQTRSTCSRVVAGAPMATRSTVRPADGRVGQEHLAAVVEPLQQRHGGDVGVDVVGPPGPQADQAERVRRDDVEPLVGLGPAGQLLGQGDVAADVGAQALGAVPAEDEPQLQRTEPAAERDLPVAEVDDGAGLGRGVAQVLRAGSTGRR